MLCSMRLREQPTFPINHVPRRRTVDRAVQTAPEVELPVKTRGRPPNAHSKVNHIRYSEKNLPILIPHIALNQNYNN
jgi:hypothetical protein